MDIDPERPREGRRATTLADAVARFERTGSFGLAFPVVVSMADTPVLHEIARHPGRSTLGRSLDDDVFVNDPTVSRRHAAIEHGPSGWFVTDLGSSNGTFVDGTRLLPGVPATLVPGATAVVLGHGARFLLAEESWLARYVQPLRAETRRLKAVDSSVRSPVHDYLVKSILDGVAVGRGEGRHQYRVERTHARVEVVHGWDALVRHLELHALDIVTVETLPADGGPRVAYYAARGFDTHAGT